MRIQNLKAPQEAPSAAQEAPSTAIAATAPAVDKSTTASEPQNLEIAFLKARIQHLELVLETARNLMGANHERLLRRLHELPRELVALSTQLGRPDVHATW
jgi:hypothetical protein